MTSTTISARRPASAPVEASRDDPGEPGARWQTVWLTALCLWLAFADAAQAQGNDADEPGALARLWERFLNRYYVGVQTDVEQPPYVGENLDFFAFPRPTSLRDYSMKEDRRFAFRDGVGFIRLAQWDHWEFNAVGFFDGRGYDPDGNAQLAGLDERGFYLGAGFGGAWRGNGVYVEAWGTQDLLGRSEGQTYSVSLGLPRRFRDDRLEFVPHIDLFFDSEDTANFYYGVELDEVAPGRPAFAADSAITTRLSTRINYRFKGCWGVRTNVNLDFLPGEVTASPIVDRDLTWEVDFAFMRRIRCEREDSR